MLLTDHRGLTHQAPFFMYNHLQAVQLTGFTQESPGKRPVFLFLPLRDAQGKLVDLWLETASLASLSVTEVCFSSWLGMPSSLLLEPLWQTLEADLVGCLHYQLASGKLGKVTVTPLPGRYLVELLEEIPPIPDNGDATDVIVLKTVEDYLQQKNRELKTFFDGALDMHSISNSQGKFFEVNHAFYQTLGYSPDELKQIPFLNLIHPDEQSWVYENLLRNILHHPVRNQVNRLRRKDGTYRIFEWNAIGIDEVVYGSARDITEREQAQEQLRALHERLQLATQAAGQGIWENNLEKNEIIWDDRLCEIHELPTSKHKRSYADYLQTIHPDDRADFLTKRQFELAGTDDRLKAIYRIHWPDGTIRWIETSGRIFRYPDGRPRRLIGVAWDITPRMLADAALRDSEQRFRQIADHVDEVFWIHSAQPFELLYINPAYERVWQRSCESIYEDPMSFIDGIVAEDKPAMQAFIQDYRAGKERQMDYQLERPDGSRCWVSVRSFIVRDAAGHIIRHLGVVTDISSQKEKELVLQQALLRTQELSQLKSQFVATVSHEFRTPLATMQSSLELINYHLASATAPLPISKHLRVIEQEIEKVTDLLSDFLSASALESGNIRVNARWFDLAALCEELLSTHFSRRQDQRRAHFLVEGTACQLYSDPRLVEHVLINLLANAFKFSTTDPPTLRIEFKPSKVVVHVIDQGIGIPLSEQSNLFQAFFRASNAGAIRGTGLGLAIARQFVEHLSGHLGVQSQEHKGSTFTMTLPINFSVLAG